MSVLSLTAVLALASDPACDAVAAGSEFAQRPPAIVIHESAGGDPCVIGVNRVRLPEWHKSELSSGRSGVFPHRWRFHERLENWSSTRPCLPGVPYPAGNLTLAFHLPVPKSARLWFPRPCVEQQGCSRASPALPAQIPEPLAAIAEQHRPDPLATTLQPHAPPDTALP